jgi:hypothetical protein
MFTLDSFINTIAFIMASICAGLSSPQESIHLSPSSESW